MISRNIKILLVSLFLSIGFWWGIQVSSESLVNFVFQRETGMHPVLFAAQLSQEELTAELLRARTARNSVIPLELEAGSALSVFIDRDGGEKVLFRKNSGAPMPIASLAKLMTALVAVKTYEIDRQVEMSLAILAEQGDAGYLKDTDVFTVRDLIYLLLMESSNDAAAALAEVIGRESFVALMNREAQNLGLSNTFFVNPTGLDPGVLGEPGNYSTSEDLVKFAVYISSSYPHLFDILSLETIDITNFKGEFHHTVINTNTILNWREWPTKILGGKTGWTLQARGCLLLVVESPQQDGYIVNVILGSEDRFGEMEKMLRWILT